ncbi:very-long-chain 3-oxoacyl-CoA reductase-B [Parasteatoda tepidariorum]|uniref:very-long-chain 3-oxoacyl-CoA reductase-B n=1 Tax=Parasteatoda tepidariorum TaxID=114398 RepID=UPI001C723158|nr:very-long-chain 3-oxoacyl-CoA reductase-B [Parasteatoda tepidariorum]
MSTVEKCIQNTDSAGILWYLGLLVFCWISFKLLRSLWRGLYTCILADLLGATVDWKKLGKWAIVTGSTDGIGKAYAKALAKKGFNIVLISRTFEKLETVAQEIEKSYSVKTKVVAVDFTKDVDIYDIIRREIEDLDIGVLVNNIGMSYKYAEYLTKIVDGVQFSDDCVKANITSCTRMTMLVLPVMEKLGKGVILNVSSLSALSPMPLLSLYSATKVYVKFLTEAVHDEYKSKGIIIQAVLPGFVSTNMSKMRPSFTTCTPEAFVKWAMKSVGVEMRTYGYPVHKLQGYIQEALIQYLPESLNLSIGHSMMQGIRKKYYKKFGLTDKEK